MIPHKERVVTIEDSAKLQMGHPHLVAMEFRPANVEGRGELTIRQLLRNSLRMRPDRVIVGEVRDAAALDMLQAMNSGHDGSMSTIHSNSARDAFSRLETMVLSGSVDLPPGRGARPDRLGNQHGHSPGTHARWQPENHSDLGDERLRRRPAGVQ
jgi:pilus assembly protein CpaF